VANVQNPPSARNRADLTHASERLTRRELQQRARETTATAQSATWRTTPAFYCGVRREAARDCTWVERSQLSVLIRAAWERGDRAEAEWATCRQGGLMRYAMTVLEWRRQEAHRTRRDVHEEAPGLRQCAVQLQQRRLAAPQYRLPATVMGSATAKLLRLVTVMPDSPDATRRISHCQLAARLGVAPAEIVRQLEWCGERIADVLVVHRDPKPPTYWLGEVDALLVASEVDTVVGAAVRDEAWWLIGQSAETRAAMFGRGQP
jgi:hypothetical protein